MKRILYVDYMRFLAIVGVLFLHITSNYITNTPIFWKLLDTKYIYIITYQIFNNIIYNDFRIAFIKKR